MNNIVKMGNREISERSLDNLIRLANAIDTTEVRENGDLYLKFKKDVIIESPNNFAILVDGFNVQYANQIHFNPEFDKEEFKKIITKNYSKEKYKTIERAAKLRSKKLLKKK